MYFLTFSQYTVFYACHIILQGHPINDDNYQQCVNVQLLYLNVYSECLFQASVSDEHLPPSGLILPRNSGADSSNQVSVFIIAILVVYKKL